MPQPSTPAPAPSTFTADMDPGSALVPPAKEGQDGAKRVSFWQTLWERPHGNIAALDGLRATAVLLVICSHYTEEFGVRYAPFIGQSRFARLPFFHFGWTGVDLFFVLSGYLIGRQLWKERFRTGTVKFTRFFLRRGFRIWPLYFVTLLVLMAFGLRHPRWADWLFLSNYFPKGYSRGWSLSTEEQFYIVVPLAVMATARLKTARAYVIALLAAVVAVELNRWRAANILVAHGFSGSKLDDALYEQFHLHCEALIAGLAIALFTVIRPEWFKRHKEAHGNLSRMGLGIFLGCSVVAITLRAIDSHVFHFLSLALIFGSLALWLLLDGSYANAIASWSWFLPISRLSYGMYLNHFYVFPVATAWAIASMRNAGVPEAVWFPFGLLLGTALSAAAAFVTFVAVERPFLTLRDRLIPSGTA